MIILHAHHTIWFICLVSQHDYDVKPLDATNYGKRTRRTILFSLSLSLNQFEDNSATFGEMIENGENVNAK